MNQKEFEDLVKESLDNLPDFFKKKLENIAIMVEDLPPPYLQKRMKLHPYALLGIYEGVPLSKRRHFYGNILPDRIVIFKKPIENLAKSKKEIKELVRKVVCHEIGHHFGFKEDDLKRMGL